MNTKVDATKATTTGADSHASSATDAQKLSDEQVQDVSGGIYLPLFPNAKPISSNDIKAMSM